MNKEEHTLDQSALTESVPTCDHCGLNCEEEHIQAEDKNFCCSGCQLVFELLHDNDLGNYYDIEDKPGISLRNKTLGNKFAYLDDEDILRKIILFTDGDLTKVSFYVPQIHCTSCLWLLEKLPELKPGVARARVNYLRKEVSIDFYSSEITLRQLVEFMAGIGYEPLISLEDLERKGRDIQTRKKHRRFYYKLGVTGFCLGNIMLLSFPEYLGISTTDKLYQNLFGFLNLVLALPVFLYGASDYLRSGFQALKHRGLNIDVPISLGIISIFAQSTFEILTEQGAGYMDSLAALVFLLLTGKWFQQKTFDNISFDRDYKSYFPIAVSALRDGKEESIPLSKLKENDEIFIRNGELIPADAVLIEGRARIDYSFVTGESEPVSCEVGKQVYAGGRQQGERIRLKLLKDVSQSYLTQLWNDEAFQKKDFKSIQSITDRIGSRFTFIILLVAAATAAFWWKEGFETAVNNFAAVLIIACPCALALNVPFTLGNALRILAKNDLYIKDTTVIERLPDTDTIVFDKTGTITSGNKEDIRFESEKPLSEEEKQLVHRLAEQSTHPVSRHIERFLRDDIIGKNPDLPDYEEVTGKGIRAKLNGLEIRLGKLEFAAFHENSKNLQDKKAIFQTHAFLSFEGKIRGCFLIKQAFREGIRETVTELGSNYRLALISGDNEGERERMEELFGTSNNLHFNQSPEDKMHFVKKEQAEKHCVMMLGDGLNDAGALQQSNIGIAVSDDVHQFSPACDAILGGRKLSSLQGFIAYAKGTRNVVYLGFALSFLYNIVGLSFAVQGLLSPLVAAVLMPLSSVSVVLLGVLGTTLLKSRLRVNTQNADAEFENV